MRSVALVLGATLLGCGGPPLVDGSYDVALSLVSDPCDLFRDAETEWDIESDGDEWSLEAEDGTEYDGEEIDNGDLEFSDERSSVLDGCSLNVRDTITIDPSDDGEGFDGSILWHGRACDGSTCDGRWDLDGELDE